MMPRPRRPLPAMGPPRLSPRDQVLAQWHGWNLAPQERAQASTAKSSGALMPQVLRKLGLDQRRVAAEVVRVWKHLLDPNVTEHAQPSGLYRGTLFVTVDSSVWLSELVRYRRREILERLQHSFGKEFIKKISFRLG